LVVKGAQISKQQQQQKKKVEHGQWWEHPTVDKWRGSQSFWTTSSTETVEMWGRARKGRKSSSLWDGRTGVVGRKDLTSTLGLMMVWPQVNHFLHLWDDMLLLRYSSSWGISGFCKPEITFCNWITHVSWGLQAMGDICPLDEAEMSAMSVPHRELPWRCWVPW
jgi:hypothetical protein